MNKLEKSFTGPAGSWAIEQQACGFIPDAEKETIIRGNRNRLKATHEELDLIESLRKGEETAFATLIDSYHGRLLRLAQAFVSNQAVAEEVVQETWLAVLDGIHRFEGRSSLKTWIFQILQNLAKTKGKREHRYISFSDFGRSTDPEEDGGMEPEQVRTSSQVTNHGTLPPTSWDQDTPERLLVEKESLDQIEQAIQVLPSNQRQVIVLRDIEGLDSEAVCQMLNITSTNQRVLLHRARSKVRLALRPYLQGFSSKTSPPLRFASVA